MNHLFFEISNSSKKQCLTIDIRYINNLGRAKFRTGAKNEKERVCYYNCNKKNRVFNRFLVAKKQTSLDGIIFHAVDLINKSNKYKDT